MLDKLVESKNNNGENRRLGSFLLTTSTGAFAVLIFALLYSLFTYNVALGNDDLNLSALIAPVKITEQAPPPKQPAEQKPQSGEKTTGKLPTRRDNMMRVDEAPIKLPTTISVARNQQTARPNSHFLIDDSDSDLSASSSGVIGRESGGRQSVGISNGIKPALEDAAKNETVESPPVLKTTPKPALPRDKKPISGGVVNGKASNLVKPIYSTAAKAVRAQGRVEVQVTIDEEGRVISADAISGNPLLIPSALSAARLSKFTPTTLSNQKVKVTGIIVYNFNAQ